MPGSGKTKIGKLLAAELGREFVDVDEFIAHETGRDSAEHLEELGDEKFLEFEARLAQKIDAKNAVIAASGSVPLQPTGIEHLKKNAFAVWLRPPLATIAAHIGHRQTGDSRIVGAKTMTLAKIWEWREKAYTKHHNAVVEIAESDSPAATLKKVQRTLRENGVI